MLQNTVHCLTKVARVSGAVVLLTYAGIEWSVRVAMKGVDWVDQYVFPDE